VVVAESPVTMCTGEKKHIDCGQLAMDIFNALKDEFKVSIFAFSLKLSACICWVCVVYGLCL